MSNFQLKYPTRYYLHWHIESLCTCICCAMSWINLVKIHSSNTCSNHVKVLKTLSPWLCQTPLFTFAESNSLNKGTSKLKFVTYLPIRCCWNSFLEHLKTARLQICMCLRCKYWWSFQCQYWSAIIDTVTNNTFVTKVWIVLNHVF